MKESEIERYFIWAVMRRGGVAYKFVSPTQRGVSDRVACMPNGETWFVELKTKEGRLAPLQKIFAAEMQRLNQNYICLWTTEGVDEWASRYDLTKMKQPTSSLNATEP
ncbi:MAG: hypothetical protein AMJ66_11355 [Betaproteobacteria bacterium SG8_40]|nr:MAG: hypothetical protein AMJ66_11355 [Betaproteobacteria bacterium SG8_40]